MDHCISTLKKEREERLFEVYVTDTLKNIGTMVAALGQGQYEAPRFADIVEIKPVEVEETRTEEEVIDTLSEELARAVG